MGERQLIHTDIYVLSPVIYLDGYSTPGNGYVPKLYAEGLSNSLDHSKTSLTAHFFKNFLRNLSHELLDVFLQLVRPNILYGKMYCTPFTISICNPYYQQSM
jgi:hypothetical protein